MDTRPSAHEASQALQSLLAAAFPNGSAPSTDSIPFPNGSTSSPAAQNSQTRQAYDSRSTTAAPAGPSAPSDELMQAFNRAVATSANEAYVAGLQHSHTMALLASQPGLFPGLTLAPPSPCAAGSNKHAPHSPQHQMHNYTPQPTRSGRMPQVPDPMAPDADRDTLLFNDYFDWPSSDDEDDPDFRPDAANTNGAGVASSVGGLTPWSDIVVGQGGGVFSPDLDFDDDGEEEEEEDYATDFSAVDEGFTPGEGLMEEAMMLRAMGSDDILAGLAGGSNGSSRIPMDSIAQLQSQSRGHDSSTSAAPTGTRRSPRSRRIASSSSPAPGSDTPTSPRSGRGSRPPSSSRATAPPPSRSSGASASRETSAAKSRNGKRLPNGARSSAHGSSGGGGGRSAAGTSPLPALAEHPNGSDVDLDVATTGQAQMDDMVLAREAQDWLARHSRDAGGGHSQNSNLGQHHQHQPQPQHPPFDLSAMLAAAAAALQNQPQDARQAPHPPPQAQAAAARNGKKRGSSAAVADDEEDDEEDEEDEEEEEEEDGSDRSRGGKRRKTKASTSSTAAAAAVKAGNGHVNGNITTGGGGGEKRKRGKSRKTLEMGEAEHVRVKKEKSRLASAALREKKKEEERMKLERMDALERENRALKARVGELEIMLGMGSGGRVATVGQQDSIDLPPLSPLNLAGISTQNVEELKKLLSWLAKQPSVNGGGMGAAV